MHLRSVDTRAHVQSTDRQIKINPAHKFLNALHAKQSSIKQFARTILLGGSLFAASGCQSTTTAINGESDRSIAAQTHHLYQPVDRNEHDEFINSLREQIQKNTNLTGTHLVSQNREAFHTRLWLFDQAKESLDLRYFRWANDNSGLLFFDAALRAAERGVHVRILLDALLLDLPKDFLLALDHHPNLDIEVYNPFGDSLTQILDFKLFEYRMHLKTMILDHQIALLGGRNIADEYFSFSSKYNYRDREVLLFGGIVPQVTNDFNEYWKNPHSVSVENLWGDIHLTDDQTSKFYQDLHTYACNKAHYPIEYRDIQSRYDQNMRRFLSHETTWAQTEYVCDPPGKEDHVDQEDWLMRKSPTSNRLSELIQNAHRSVLMQMPYVGLSPQSRSAFQIAHDHQVQIELSTCHLNSTAVMACYSVYRGQLDELGKLGIRAFEFKSKPLDSAHYLGVPADDQQPPMWLHAKSFVIDGQISFVGTSNFNPRSNCLNTEEGVIVHDTDFSLKLQDEIHRDMLPENSWTAENAPRFDRRKVVNGLLYAILQILPENIKQEF